MHGLLQLLAVNMTRSLASGTFAERQPRFVTACKLKAVVDCPDGTKAGSAVVLVRKKHSHFLSVCQKAYLIEVGDVSLTAVLL